MGGEKMATQDTVLVTGITGQQGGATARSLMRRGVKVYGLTRNLAKAEEWRKFGVQVLAGDLTDRKSMDAALKNVKKVFLVTTPLESGMDAEVRQGTTVIDAAKAAGVSHLVFTSVIGANRKTGIPHFETKGRIEEHLRESGVPATVLRPVFFMENFGSPWMLPGIQSGKLVNPVRPDRRLQMIALRDIGEFATEAFHRPKEFIGHAIDLAGDEMTFPEALDILSRTLGKPVRYEVLPDDQLEKAVGHDMALMYRWFNGQGHGNIKNVHADVKALEKQWGIPLTKFRELVAEARWAKAA